MTDPKITIETKRNNGFYIGLSSGEVEDLGVFNNVLSSCKFVFFSGRGIDFTNQEGEFLFRPIIWSTLNLSYEAIQGGSNGMDYQISKDQKSNVWYDIVEGKFNTYDEQAKKEVDYAKHDGSFGGDDSEI